MIKQSKHCTSYICQVLGTICKEGVDLTASDVWSSNVKGKPYACVVLPSRGPGPSVHSSFVSFQSGKHHVNIGQGPGRVEVKDSDNLSLARRGRFFFLTLSLEDSPDPEWSVILDLAQ